MTTEKKNERVERAKRTKTLLLALKALGASDAEIAFNVNACVHSLVRWRAGTVPTAAYFKALCDFASKRGVKNGK